MARVIITDLSEATIARYGGWNVVTPGPARRAAAEEGGPGPDSGDDAGGSTGDTDDAPAAGPGESGEE